MAITGRHPTPTPLALSDAQITTTMGLARPLQPQQRTAFLEMIAAKLNGRREIGDGQLHPAVRRATAETFRSTQSGARARAALVEPPP
jgi:hypothetical protein